MNETKQGGPKNGQMTPQVSKKSSPLLQNIQDVKMKTCQILSKERVSKRKRSPEKEIERICGADLTSRSRTETGGCAAFQKTVSFQIALENSHLLEPSVIWLAQALVCICVLFGKCLHKW